MRANLKNKRAFTLKEMLVVVTAITVLVAILIPSVGSARRTAQRAACLSNLRQLGYSFLAYANDSAGKTLPTSDKANPPQIWTASLLDYSSRVGTDQNNSIDKTKRLLLSNLCPTASNLSKAVGTNTLGWGPTTSKYCSTLAPGAQFGSYGMNGQLYSTNPTPPEQSILSAPVGVIAKFINTSGNHSVYGDAFATNSISLGGAAQISGNAYSGGSISNGVGGTKYPNYDITKIPIPDVSALYTQLSNYPKTTRGAVSGNTVLDFSTVQVIQVNGNADFGNTSTIGSGTVLVSGNVTGLCSSLTPTFNIICLGSVDLKNGKLTGSIYCKGDASGNGNGRINGNVVTEGTYGGNGGPDVYASSFPDWDDTYSRPGFVNSINTATDNAAQVPIFADSVWFEAWPSTGDIVPTDLINGNKAATTGIGQFFINRHGNAINVVFLDGHAETVALKNLKGLKWSRSF